MDGGRRRHVGVLGARIGPSGDERTPESRLRPEDSFPARRKAQYLAFLSIDRA